MLRNLAGALLSMAMMLAAEPPWFSHKLHANVMGACTSCHRGAEKSARAGMPAASRCLACHKGTLQLRSNSHPFQAEYDNLPDYVRFSHARHARGKVPCQECHGDATRQDETEPSKALNMKTCMDCHTQWKASVACGACHSIR